jgi:dTDP-4-amino-4,6-dideoxygalactose transaminase
MSKLQRVFYLFSSDSIHFLQPYWKQEQWKIALSIFNRQKFSESSNDIENEFLKLSGAKYARSFNLGRSAIQIVLESFGFPAESEVILPSFNCAGVITPVIFAGHIPVLVDFDQDFNILAASVNQAISPKTRAIILPHLSGKLARDFFEILEIARKNDLKVIVDATQALGLTASNKWVGYFGDAGIYSFNGGKLIPGSGGGLLVTNNEHVISYCKSRVFPPSNVKEGNVRIFQYILKHGMHKVTFPIYSLMDAGRHLINSKRNPKIKKDNNGAFSIEELDAIEAALVLSQMKFLPEIIEKRKQNALQLINSNVLQDLGFKIPDITDNIFTKFLVTHENPEISYHIRKTLINYGIETEQSYTPLALRDISQTARKIDTPNTDRYWKGAFSFPISPLLGPKDIDRMIHVLKTKIRSG